MPPYRLRVGDYRVLFDIEDNTITVYRVSIEKMFITNLDLFSPLQGV